MNTYHYTISVDRSKMTQCDTAIELYLLQFPDASVDDALNAIFEIGVDSMIAIYVPENSKPETENEVLP